jgi:transposase
MEDQQVSKKLDFLGEEIYVGIDVHKKQWNVFIMSNHKEHKGFSQPAEAGALARYLRNNFPGATYYSVYEAGFCGFWPHQELEKEGIHNIVVNPADVPSMDKEKKHKCDKVDCRKLCRSLRSGDLEAIYIPDRVQLEERELVRLRAKLVRDERRCKCRIKGMLNLYGLSPRSSRWTKAFKDWLKEMKLNTVSGTFALQTLVLELEHISEVKKRVARQLRTLVKDSRYVHPIKLLYGIPGVGLVTALTFLTELGDTSRFKRLDQLCNYIGLVPCQHSSGDEERLGNITPRKNTHMMAILIESAWIAVGKDPALMQAYHKLCRRMKGQEAIIRIARKLIARMRYVLLHQTEYQLKVAA